MSELYKKVNQSVKLLKTVSKTIDEPIELCYSGGKDSDVILALAKMAGIDIQPIYKNTTIDPPGTIKHCRDNGVEIVHPKKSFFKIIEQKGYPSRFHRFCCSELKEYKILDNAIQGIRRCESPKRAERYKEPIICRMYSKKEHVNTILPILAWTNDDVKEFVTSENIQCHPLYYNDNLEFCVSRRLGCIGCPLQTRKNRIRNFSQYPKMLNAWVAHGDVWFLRMKEKGNITSKRFNDVYELFLFSLFYDKLDDFDLHRNLFGSQSAKRMLEDYFKIDL